MPMVPEAVDRDAGLRADRRGALGGVRRVRRRTSSRRASTTPRPTVVVSASCGIEADRVIEYKPLLDARARARRAPAGALRRSCSARRPRRRWSPGATSTGPRLMAGRRAGRLRAGRGDRPALHPLHLRHDRQAQGRRARQRRARGRAGLDACRTSTTSAPGEVFWAASDVGWVVGHSYIVYAPLLVGATTVLYEGKPVGTPDAGRVLAGGRRARRQGAVHRADRVPGDQEGGPRRRAAGASTTCRRCGTCSWPASGSTPTPTTGRRSSSASRSSTTGGRPRPAGRSPPTCVGSSRCRSSRARRPCRCRATTCGSSTATASRVPRRRGGRDRASSCRCRPGTLPTLWGDDDRFVASYLSRLRRATT